MNLEKYKHKRLARLQYYPYKLAPRKYGKESNEVEELKDSPQVGKQEKKLVQQVLGNLFYYARTVDLIFKQAPDALVKEQSNPMEKNLENIEKSWII